MICHCTDMYNIPLGDSEPTYWHSTAVLRCHKFASAAAACCLGGLHVK
jgi:hypothetical protein